MSRGQNKRQPIWYRGVKHGQRLGPPQKSNFQVKCMHKIPWNDRVPPKKRHLNFILGSCNRFWRCLIWLYDYQLPLFLLTRACPFMPHSCCRWRKSCTSWYGEYPFLYVVSILYHFFIWFNVSQLVRALQLDEILLDAGSAALGDAGQPMLPQALDFCGTRGSNIVVAIVA